MATTLLDPDALTSRTEFAAALTALREQAGLTVRELAKRLDARPATLGGYFSGRHVPPANQATMLTALLRECGVTDPHALQSWLAATARVRATTDRRGREHRAPFRGLASFEAEDAALFFARDHEMDRLVQLVRDGDHPTIAVVGPSGSGKSSVLHAGLVAAIRAGRLDEPDGRCSYVVVTPGTAALERLSAALDQLIEPGPRILVIDQLEELFTSRYELDERYRFLDLLEGRDAEIVVVFGLRADFYAPAAREPVLLSALQDAQVLVGPLDRDGVRETITGPTSEVGVTLENGFVDVVLADLGPQDEVADSQAVSSLPLLGHALLATWNRSSGSRLTIEDYRATGGINGAVERTAESVYGRLSDLGRRTARALFLRLVTVDELTVTRRRIRWSELEGMIGAQAGDVAGTFVGARLLTAFADGLEMSHEALLRSWPRLQGWIDDDREALRVRRRITDNAAEWERSDRDPAALMRGTRLDAAAEWAAGAPAGLALTASEQEYLDRGLAHAAAQRQRERRAQGRSRRALAAVAVLAVIAVVLAVVSLIAGHSADVSRRAAAAALRDALSREVAQRAAELTDADPALAEQLALAAYRIAPTDAARGALVAQSVHPVMTRRLGSPGPTALATSRDGRTIAVSRADDGSVHLYRTRGALPPVASGVLTGAGPGVFGHQQFALAFSPDGHLLATGGQEDRVSVWNVANPKRPVRLTTLGPAFAGAVQSIAISPDGRRLVASSAGAHPVQQWTIGGDDRTFRPVAPPRGVPAGTTVQSVAFDAAGTRLAAGGTSGALLLWPAAQADRTAPVALPADPATTVNSVAFSPDGSRLYEGQYGGRVVVWSTGGRPRHPIKILDGPSDSRVNVVAVSPDGDEVAVGAGDNTLARWSTRTWESRGVTHNPGPVTGIRYSPSRSTIMTTAADGALRLVSRTDLRLPVVGSVFALSFSTDGSRLAVGTSGENGNIRVWDVRDRLQPHALTDPLTIGGTTPAVDGTGAVRPDGMLLAAGNSVGQVQLWDLHDIRNPRRVSTPFSASRTLVESLAFSPDGTRLAVASDDHHVTLFDVADPAHPRRLWAMGGRDLMLGVAFSPDGRMVAGANADNSAYVWNIAAPQGPRLVAHLHDFVNYVYGVAFSRDGHLFAATSSDHTARVWRVSDDHRFTPYGRPLIGPTDYAYAASFDRSGRRLAIGSNDGTVRVYDVGDAPSGVPLQTLTAVGAPVFAVAYSPDGSELLGGGRGDTVIDWTTTVGDYARRVCPFVGDRITQTEWSLYVPGMPYHPPCGITR